MSKRPTHEELEQRLKELEEEALERNQAEEALKESEEKYRRIFESIQDVYYEVSFDGIILEVSPSIKEASQYKREELIGKSLYDIYVDPNKREKFIKELQKKGRVSDYEIALKDKDGSQRDCSITARLITDPQGGPVRIVGSLRDVGKRKRAENALQEAHDELERRVEDRTAELSRAIIQLKEEIEERKRAEEAVRESEKRFRRIVEDTEAGYFCVDQEGLFRDVNEAWLRMHGYSSRDDVIGQHFGFTQVDEDLEAAQKIVESVLRGETIKTREFSRRCKDRSVGYHIFSAGPVERRGKIVGLEGFLIDVTERKMAQEARKVLEAKVQQAQKLEAIGTLASGIAHDFNNLLMGIQGNVSLIQLDLDSTHPHYKRLENIEKQVQNGAMLTSELIAYARRRRYEVRPLDLNQLVKDTSETFGRTRKEITIHLRLFDNLLSIEADSGQMEQVLFNLFVNAADSMPRGGDLFLKTINVTHKDMRGKLYEPKRGDYVLLTVADTGMGMERETLERVFDPFFTTKEMGRGTGLGLASAYGIIKAHGGYIDVGSKKGQGTTFSIYLPGSKRPVLKVVKTVEAVVEGAGTVLLVDDEAVVLEVGRDLLEAMGYRVLVARDGKQGVEVYKKNQDEINIVVLDIVMPHMGGGEAYDRLKEINPNVKVLLSSGFSIHSEAAEILERGCDGFIQKPFKMKDLSQAIKEVLGKE